MSKFSIGCVMWCSARNLHLESKLTGSYTVTPLCPLVPHCPELLAKHQIPQVPQYPYSLDMAPREFFLFPGVKMLLKGNRFQSME